MTQMKMRGIYLRHLRNLWMNFPLEFQSNNCEVFRLKAWETGKSVPTLLGREMHSLALRASMAR